MKLLNIGVRRLSLIAMLSSLSFVSRMMFSFLPNVKPTTVIITLIAMYIGTYDALLVALISIFMSNLYLGMGVWTIAQLVSFSVLVIIVHICKKMKINIKYYPLIVFILGLVYGLVISLVQAPFFGWASFFPYYLSGLTYDFNHAIGNFIFFIVLHKPLSKILKIQKEKMMF